MKHELTIIAPEELTVLDKIKLEELIKKYARIHKRLVEGRKRLAYPIQGREWGLYLFYELDIDRDKVSELSCELNINDKVVRYLLVRQDSRRAIHE